MYEFRHTLVAFILLSLSFLVLNCTIHDFNWVKKKNGPILPSCIISYIGSIFIRFFCTPTIFFLIYVKSERKKVLKMKENFYEA